MSVSSNAPRDALSHVKVLARFPHPERNQLAASLVRVRPETGRMHQIRVHLASIAHPCLGDPLYGGRSHDSRGEFARQALHALALSFDHPRTKVRMDFVAPIPLDFAEFLGAHGYDASAEAARAWIADA